MYKIKQNPHKTKYWIRVPKYKLLISNSKSIKGSGIYILDCFFFGHKMSQYSKIIQCHNILTYYTIMRTCMYIPSQK